MMFEPDGAAALVLGGMMLACVVTVMIYAAFHNRPSAE